MTKTLLITGASSGIGAATAKAAAKAGWNVALLARSADRLEALASDIGDAALPIECDVTDRGALTTAVSRTIAKFGALDAVFANAGKGVSKAGTENGDPDEWHDMIHINILAVLYTAHATLPELRKTNGHFVVTGSKAGRDHLKGSIYGATKWFVHGFAGNLAQEMREWGGRCTVISPGMVNTEFFDEPKPDKLQPEDVADAVVFALSQPDTSAVHEIHLMPND
ncbi:SDR family oxidoreductase [Pontixanthobacter aestiaquae]|uniref:SDR family NAD(P)-dependent oxidoreductase n=1 Tax=Pontixanthobacter aestiaquae TaxID=1509367 RepID=A0A844Z544_9SPHN|nr:SDR family oxidoreductase [Pontixanthobacter aestiaquae]MDN3645217.1 SDR family oxidoreductase [Pontixanthobacter aestiaquae]MXO83781.1 SDR family NAD(P)-dependent oxidoreductase [Pontixanthobacter aestiaquae]